jgi:XTP/dITP diphosphohydrolase
MIHRTRLELLIATGNIGKLREIGESLRGLPLTLRYLQEFPDVSPVEEVGQTYKENAILKALSYSKHTAVLALADDSGLEVDALGGAPGVLSARYGGDHASDRERTTKLLTTLSRYPGQARTARFVCCVALAGERGGDQPYNAHPRVLHVSEGRCEGVIIERPRGNNGFGYDPVFVPSGYSRTFAELPAKIKNAISHRAQALAAMRQFLESMELDR